jgi:hypothetical protein
MIIITNCLELLGEAFLKVDSYLDLVEIPKEEACQVELLSFQEEASYLEGAFSYIQGVACP